MGHEPGDDDEVEPAGARHLVRDVHVAASRIPDRRVHAAILAHDDAHSVDLSFLDVARPRERVGS
jgi:hypothetical protein